MQSHSKHKYLTPNYCVILADPSKYQEGPSNQIPVTILGLDLDENLQEVR